MGLERTWGVIFGLIALLILAKTSLAGNPLEGAKAAAMGGAFAAVADDPSAIAHNQLSILVVICWGKDLVSSSSRR